LHAASGWERATSGLGRVEYVTGKPAAELVVKCRAREFTVGYWRRKDRTGIVAVSVDGKDVDTLRSEFPEDWGGGGYLQLKRIFQASEPSERMVGFRLLSGDTLELKAFLYAGK
jgi:hypothetical protein